MKTLLTLGLLVSSVAFANTSDKVEYKGAMKEIPKAVIEFSADSAVLSDAEKTKLNDLINTARAKGEIDQVTVAVWSDKRFPAAKNAKLSASDRNLADLRAETIKTYLKDSLAVADTDTYSMAEDSNWLAKTFNTKGAELKSAFSKKGEEAPVTNAEFQIIKNEGGPSKAVLVVEHEHD